MSGSSVLCWDSSSYLEFAHQLVGGFCREYLQLHCGIQHPSSLWACSQPLTSSPYYSRSVCQILSPICIWSLCCFFWSYCNLQILVMSAVYPLMHICILGFKVLHIHTWHGWNVWWKKSVVGGEGKQLGSNGAVFPEEELETHTIAEWKEEKKGLVNMTQHSLVSVSGLSCYCSHCLIGSWIRSLT
jgi:hypothetical protein